MTAPVAPSVGGTGEVFVTNDGGHCGLVRIDLEDASGNVLHTARSAQLCPKGDRTKHLAIALETVRDPDAARAEISIEDSSLATGTKVIPAASPLFANTHSDSFTIDKVGIDLVGGRVDWSLGAGQVTPGVYGTLVLDGVNNTRARVNVRYLDADGNLLAEKHGKSLLAQDDGHYEASVGIRSFASSEIARVKVQVQTKVGTKWKALASKTLSIEA